MKPAAFEYHCAQTPAHALTLKAQHGEEARFLAGGQSLIPAMNFRLAQPAVLIDINPLSGLAGIDAGEGGTLRIGAMTRYRSLERSAMLREQQPLLAEAVPNVAHPQIRNRGTLGGNLAHADGASELPAVMLALRASMIVHSVRGERRVAADVFFVDMFTTALADDELLVAIDLPAMAPGSGSAFIEVSRRRGDYAMMGVAAVVTLDAAGRCRDAALACCSAGPTPMLLAQTAAALIGSDVDPQAIEHAAIVARTEMEPIGNLHAGAGFKRHLLGVLVGRALATAAGRARAARTQ